MSNRSVREQLARIQQRTRPGEAPAELRRVPLEEATARDHLDAMKGRAEITNSNDDDQTEDHQP